MRSFLVFFFALLAVLVDLRLVASIDEAILHFFVIWRPIAATQAMNWVFRLGFAQVDAAVALIWAGVLVMRRQLRTGVFLPFLVFLAIGLQAVLNIFVNQPGPGVAYASSRSFAVDPVSSVLDTSDAAARAVFVAQTSKAAASSPSAKVTASPIGELPHTFPSGHSLRTLLLALLAVDGLRSWKRLRSPFWRWAPAILLFMLAGLVGYSTLYFGYHWPSDVAGGWLAAIVLYRITAPLKVDSPRTAPSGRFQGSAKGARAVVKPLLDYLVAAIGLFLLSPMLLATALIVKLDSPGPIFFRRKVLGKGGTTFRLFKFRTMCADAEIVLQSDEQLRQEFERNFKIQGDPRVTRVGKFLRRSSLDELPQLLNVLAGQMSLVGPRTIGPEELHKYGERQADLLAIKPGITGLWQVSGRSDIPYEERVQIDIHYVYNQSFLLDLRIMLRTFPVVFRGKGAY